MELYDQILKYDINTNTILKVKYIFFFLHLFFNLSCIKVIQYLHKAYLSNSSAIRATQVH